MTTRSLPVRAKTLAFGVSLALAAVGCTDAASDPMAALTGQETRPALNVGSDLPTMTVVWTESGGVVDAGPVRRWEDSWTMEPGQGREIRASLYAEIVPEVLERNGPGEVRRVLVRMDSTLMRLDAISAVGVPERISRRLDSAHEMLASAWVLADEGDSEASLVAAFQASDYLVEVTPRRVASRLLSSAEEGLRRISSSGSYSEEIVGRATRLIEVAGQATQDGDYARAIRGSYYACLLLGVDLPE